MKSISNINIASRSLAAATTDTIGLITTADSPDHTLVSNGTNVAQVDRNSRITGIKVILSIVAAPAPDDPIPVGVMLWKDNQYGQATPPTTTDDILVPSTTMTLANQKANTCMFRRFYLTGVSDKYTMSLKIPRRLRTLREGEFIRLIVSNLEAADEAIEWMAHGRIWTSC